MASSPDKSVTLEEMMPLIKMQLAAGNKVTFGPRGISMIPLLRQGIDSVELSPLPEGKLKKYDLPLYQRPSGNYTLHRIVKVGQTYTCIGDNQFVYEPGVKHEQMIAVVSGIYRGDKYVSTDALSYKLYCRFWHMIRPVRKLRHRFEAWLKRILKMK